MLTASLENRARIFAFVEILLAGLLFYANTSFYAEHRLYAQLLNYGLNYAYVLNPGEARFFLASILTAIPSVLLLLDASLRLARPNARVVAHPRATIALLAVIGVLLAELVARLFGHAQFTDDERVYLWQAKNLLHGMFTAPRPQPAPFFHARFWFMVQTPGGEWGSIYPPGVPALIALGLAVNAAHLPQLICVGLIIWMAGRFAQELWDGQVAVICALLLALSPLLVFSGATLHNSVATTLFTLMALRFAYRYWRRGLIRDCALAGFGVGAAMVCRPLDGMLAGIMAGAMVIAGLLAPPAESASGTRRWVGVGCGALIGLAFLAFLFASQEAVTGSYTVAPYARFIELWQGAHIFGFGLTAFGTVHTPALAFSKAVVTMARLNAWSFGWPFALLGPLLVFIGVGRDCASTWILVGLVLHLLAYFVYSAPSVHTFGSYYELPQVPLIALLTGHLFVHLRDRLRPLGDVAAAIPMRLLLVLSVVGFLFFWPGELTSLTRTADLINAPLRAAEKAAQDGPVIVFHRRMQPYREGHATSWVFWPPLTSAAMTEPVIWASDLGICNSELVNRMPGRRALFMQWNHSNEEPELLEWRPPPSTVDGRPLPIDCRAIWAMKPWPLEIQQPSQMVVPEVYPPPPVDSR